MERSTPLIDQTKDTSVPLFPLVGIGASAGGLEAFTHLLEHLSATTGMAYIVVQHLDPTHKSLLADLLTRATRMDVREAREGMEVRANHVYLIAPNTDLTLTHGRLKLVPQTKTAGQHLSIDTFLVSLAEHARHQAIGVLLSGAGSDGTRGLQAIKEFGGVTLAQDAASAQYAAMPQHAIAAGCVDFIGSPTDIASELTRISRFPSVSLANVTRSQKETDMAETFSQMLQLLSQRTGVDFTLYKPAMLKRRVQRRMALSQMDSQFTYLTYLRAHQEEVVALSQDFLIGVTAFFRDPATNHVLVDEVFPRLIEAHSSPGPVRIWVPGCSTGEEVYSLAICFSEFLQEQSNTTPFQIFGTDLNGTAIEQARNGIYSSEALSGVSSERRERFFLAVNGQARISTSIRDHCVFARHNLLKDPPFSHLDLLVCQNVLIYLGPDAQKKSFQMFHYALSPHGLLLLGTSETIGTASDLFVHTGHHHHLYLTKATSVRSWGVSDMRESVREKLPDLSKEGNLMRFEDRTRSFDIQKEADRLLLAKYAPASVVVDAEMEILQFRGRTHPYLRPATGKASFNLFKMARESLGIELRTAIARARKSGQSVKKAGIQLKDQGVLREVQVEVIPMQTSATECSFVIVFDEPSTPLDAPAVQTPVAAHQAEKNARGVKDRRIEHLERELETTREQMHAIVEDLETTNEELQAANEEILSSNEELRSLNEELETSKEEIQASNEELLAVNQELKQSNTQLYTAREYADAIVETIREPLLVLDEDLRVQRANPAFYQFFLTEPAQTEHALLFSLEGGLWDIPALRTLLEDLLPTNHAFTDYTMTYTFPRIGHKTMLLNAHRIDHVPLILLAMEDITALSQAVEEKQRALSQREEFMAIASHELKTPVTSLKGYVQLLHHRFQIAGDEQASSMLAKVDGRINRLVALINELLDVTTIEAGQLQWLTEAFDLNELVRTCVDDALQTTPQQIRIEGSLALPAFGNAEHLGQVLINVLSNAIKYSPQTEDILVTLQAEQGAAIVGVHDSGIGIALEKQAHLFERFFRVSGPGQVKVPGLGLGLYISAEIVKRQGGRMWVESSPGKGSTFFFSVPLA